MRLTARRARLIRLGVVMARSHLLARGEGWHAAAFALLLSFRAGWGIDTLPRRAFERTIQKGYDRG